MPTPTRPGWYRWRPNPSEPWVIVEVAQFRDGDWLDPSLVTIGVAGGRAWACSVERLAKSSCEWGPRIPEPPPEPGPWVLVYRKASEVQDVLDAFKRKVPDADTD